MPAAALTRTIKAKAEMLDPSRYGRSDRSPLGRWFWEIDRVLLLLVAVLIGIGLIAVAAASPAAGQRYSGGSVRFAELHYFYRQLMWIAVSLPVMIGISMMPREQLRRWSISGAVLFLVLLAVAFLPCDLALPLGQHQQRPQHHQQRQRVAVELEVAGGPGTCAAEDFVLLRPRHAHGDVRGVGMFEQAQAGGGETAVEVVAQFGVNQNLPHCDVFAWQPAFGQQACDQGGDGIGHCASTGSSDCSVDGCGLARDFFFCFCCRSSFCCCSSFCCSSFCCTPSCRCSSSCFCSSSPRRRG